MSKQAIQPIDVEDVPEPAVAALRLVTELLRGRTAVIRVRPPKAVGHSLLQKEGTVKGPLTRTEIYEEDVL